MKRIFKSLNSAFILPLTLISVLSIIIINSVLVTGEIRRRNKEIADYEINTRSLRIMDIEKTIGNLVSFVYYDFRHREDSLLHNCRDRLLALSNYCSFSSDNSAICNPSEIFGRDFLYFEDNIHYFVSDYNGNVLFSSSPSLNFNESQSNIYKKWKANLSSRNIELHDEAGFLYQNNFIFIRNDRQKLYYAYYLEKSSLYRKIASEIFRELFNDLSGEINFFAGTYEGVSLAGPEMGRNMILDPAGNSADVVRRLIDKALSGGGVVEYQMPPVLVISASRPGDNTKRINKLSYVTAIPVAGAYIGSGIYLEDLETEVRQKRSELAGMIFSNLTEELVLALLASIIIVATASLIRGLFKKDISEFMDFFGNAAEKDILINPDKVTFSEFRQIAESANRMIENKKKLHDIMLKNYLNSSVMRLAGGIAHEFNNQLMGISGYAELLPGENDSRKKEEYLKRILLGVEKSRELVNSLLSYARKDVKKSERVDISVIIKKCIMLLDLSFNKNIKVSSEIMPGCIVTGDSEQLFKMIMNISLNSVDALQKGGEIFFRVSFSKNRSGKPRVIISITDSGDGIDPSLRDTIFEPFFTTRENSYNTGMGLAAAAGIAGSHGGEIWFESEKGRGTVFYISLPAAEQD